MQSIFSSLYFLFQLCTVGSTTTCAANSYCKQIPYYPTGNGNCTAIPTEGQACDSVGGCAAGLLCTENFMCKSCGPICMAADYVQRTLEYYNMGCGRCARVPTFRHSGSRESHHGFHHQGYYHAGFNRARLNFVNRILYMINWTTKTFSI